MREHKFELPQDVLHSMGELRNVALVLKGLFKGQIILFQVIFWLGLLALFLGLDAFTLLRPMTIPSIVFQAPPPGLSVDCLFLLFV